MEAGGVCVQHVASCEQWRPEGLQRPGANACIGAPPLGAPPLIKPNTLALGQKSTSKKEKKKRVFNLKENIKAPLMHMERGALGSAAIKISPYTLGGRPLQGLRPGAMPPPRYATGCEAGKSEPETELFIWVVCPIAQL